MTTGMKTAAITCATFTWLATGFARAQTEPPPAPTTTEPTPAPEPPPAPATPPPAAASPPAPPAPPAAPVYPPPPYYAWPPPLPPEAPPVVVKPWTHEPRASVPLRLALQTEGAFGVVTGKFHNQLVGGRLDGSFTPRVSLGAAVAYANLKGKDGRASSALALAQVEYLFGAEGATTRVPLRFAPGYLFGNGPVVRVSGGLQLRLTPKLFAVAELAPMVWVTNNQTLLSLDLALELLVRL